MKFDFPKLEKEILDFWKKNKVFEKSLEARKNKRPFIFYEGPPGLNGSPGLHHTLSRVFKDIVCRYKTMQGFLVERKAGWDVHGLPVELQAEKELGIKTKKEIEKYGVEEFNEKCKEIIKRYKKEWEDLTERIGFWLDLKNPYITSDPDYIETLFWIIKNLWKKGFLYQDFKIVAWCPRCQTALSSHEVAQGYKKVEDPSLFVKVKLKKFKKRNTYLLIWTTTPWTLPANIAVAVNPRFDYVLIKKDKEHLILAKKRLKEVLKDQDYKVLEEFKGKMLEGLSYFPLFSLPKDISLSYHKVVLADFVSLDEGTGLVHLAPAFGEEDYQVFVSKIKKEISKSASPPITVNEEGKMKKGIIGEGKFVKEADKLIIKDLKKRNLVFKIETYLHDYPFCWRCKTPLLYYLHRSWFLNVKKVKRKLLQNNKKINWIPSYLKEGRFGNFLKEVRDWNFSRERYWGTPLPVWKCGKCGNIFVLGSKEELRKRKYSSNRYFLMRHGFSEKNKKRIIDLDLEGKRPLTKEGKKEARESLENLSRKVKIDVIYSSDILRAKETAEIAKKIFPKAKLYFEKDLRDTNFGEYEGKPEKEFYEKIGSLEEVFKTPPKGGESWGECLKRVLKVVQKIDKRHKGKNILIISHGDPLWLLEGAFAGKERKELIALRKESYIKTGEIREVIFRIFPYNREGEIDFHRPWIDEVEFLCEKCGGRMKREKVVCDVWFDSGAMPFAQCHFPFEIKKETFLKQKFPADYICEGIDQTRGWFYTLLCVSTLLSFGPSYKNVISLGHVLDKKGEKMSKSKGNVVDPWMIVDKYGADSLRWYFFTINQPWDSKNFDEVQVRKAFNKFILTFFNSFLFWKQYSPSLNLSQKEIEKIIQKKRKKILDDWILSKLEDLKQKVNRLLDKFDIVSAAREIEKFTLDHLSNWYIRRSRERFQKPKTKNELKEASICLGFCLCLLYTSPSPRDRG